MEALNYNGLCAQNVQPKKARPLPLSPSAIWP